MQTVRVFTSGEGRTQRFGERDITMTPAVEASEGGALSAYSASFGAGEVADLPAPYEEVWVVLSGQLRLDSHGQSLTARTGDLVHVPSDSPGTVEALELTALACVSVPAH